MTTDERTAIERAAQRAASMSDALGITFEAAAREIARGSALYEETVAAILATRPDERAEAEARISALLPELAETIDAWINRDREDWRDSNRLAGRLQLHMRSISANAAEIARIDSRDHWWGVGAHRE